MAMEEQESIHRQQHHIHMNVDLFLAGISHPLGIAGLQYLRYDIANPVSGRKPRIPEVRGKKECLLHFEA
jgi:hypothetical protein